MSNLQNSICPRCRHAPQLDVPGRGRHQTQPPHSLVAALTLPLTLAATALVLAILVLTGGDGVLFKLCREDEQRRKKAIIKYK